MNTIVTIDPNQVTGDDPAYSPRRLALGVGVSKRNIGYVVVAVLLVAGLVVAYFALQDPDPGQAAPQPKPVLFTWSDGSELRPDTASAKLLVEQAKRELDAAGITADTLSHKGYTVGLTLERAAQERGERILNEARQGQPGNLRMALVAVDPRTGRIVALNGYQAEKAEFDYTRAWQNPGSTFMPFDLVALLQKGKGLGEVYDGSSPRAFGKNCGTEGAKCLEVSNTDNNACGKHCSVARAMELSVNTVFADIAYNEVGTLAVARAAIDAGIPPNVGIKKIPLEGEAGVAPNIAIALGGDVYQARPVDIASAYATFAANGTKRAPHMVAKVTDPTTNQIVLANTEAQAAGKPAFDEDVPDLNAKIARNVTEALLPAAAKFPCAGNRPCAGKAGVHGCTAVEGKTKKSDNCATWMTGYTPQLSASVWLGTDDNSALRDKTGAVLDSTLAAQAWQKFMNEYLQGQPVEQFPAYVAIGKSPAEAVIPAR
ncbi:membrane peptidoglycan carboxypeptidase [Kibdelosporangium banguiense]|uniref:Membrane peptidoglycan carboxypeptidase n=1 Tax=Kibdelosporangium banguiense TaxID=1365924 RepID=A0ABS4TST1_9PSEU|nr:penicillin-binding transpeptidase domain-containing protein [Kibdelosporangium banguiense]MBP2327005.1 membrane peptidoglycan carboxypeptidase [Kibdelosporangium banguiense]